MTTRRTLLKATGAGLLAFGAPLPFGLRSGLASANPLTDGKLKFLFVFNSGGWDPTRVLVDGFDNAAIDMEPEAGRASVGDLNYISHPDRPSVDGFFEAWGDRTAVCNGMLVRSIAHEICTVLALTGDSSGTRPDWPAILANEVREDFIIPHVVLDGPSFPGDLGVAVARAGGQGQLDALIDGSALDLSTMAAGGPSHPAEGIMDAYMLRRAQAAAGGATSAAQAKLAGDLSHAVEQARALKDLRYVMDFSVGSTLASQAQVAADLLSLGVARCATLRQAASWDTHADNDNLQSPLWESLFDGLNQLMSVLQTTPGELAPTLADETVVVVLSEMGRTPQLNGFEGKDHWPYTSAMLIGPSVQGGRVYGGLDSQVYGLPIDPISGDTGGEQLFSAEALGATLLAMADIDPGPFVQGVSPIMGMMK